MLGFNGGLMGVRRTPTGSAASGLWFQNEQSVAKRAAIWPAAGGDEYWANVSLLLHMDGSNGSTTFTDSSSNAFTVTANGNAQISTAQSKFGGASGLFDGTGDWLSIPEASALELSADFTIECWIRTSSTSDMVIGSSKNGTNTQILRINSGSSGNLDFYAPVYGWVYQGVAAGITTSTWHHLALTRSGSNTRMFVDGVQKGTTVTDWTGTIAMDIVGALFIGGSHYTAPAIDFNGYIDDLRITKGVARYTANFTAPAAAFPDA